MTYSPFDNLPPLSQKEALQILSTPVSELKLVSDYYKAVFHLIKYPGSKTEKALLNLLESEDNDQAVLIAKRKAVEGLATLGSKSSIPVIGKCLKTSDPYLTENAAWALKVLNCNDNALHKVIIELLDDPRQNTRNLIQCLAGMKVYSAVEKIRTFLYNSNTSESIRGASIAALSQLSGEKCFIEELEEHLLLPNQNQRHSAIQDAIDFGSLDLLPAVLKAPVSVSFRLRAFESLWPEGLDYFQGFRPIEVVDSFIFDKPSNLNLVHKYDAPPTIDFLFEELFGTDFSRCYLALKTLQEYKSDEISPKLGFYLKKASKDYGAIYFLISLFRAIPDWGEQEIKEIESFLIRSLDIYWPDFMKFKPLSIVTLSEINPVRAMNYLDYFTDPDSTRFWVSRYAAIIAIENILRSDQLIIANNRWLRLKQDPNYFVRQKAGLVFRD
ncbi:HEAT repeat domain-containing protein [Prochlorococcus sp. MIT 1300]|uniref:HEAT repeat domain-containing protein n=1 Tax=Prochlorococcus sp. MIT 1300 TaxID=3096218 RepID=UPI002A75FC0D|nr:HEAT repeat domain-containing protein [Prochlorococcus sp. MIT 1300]